MFDIQDVLTLTAIAFIVGFKIAAWMDARHLEEMKRIWRKTQSAAPKDD
jgi:hypothetical protein